MAKPELPSEPIGFAAVGRYRLPPIMVDSIPLGDFDFDYVWRDKAEDEVGQVSATVLPGKGAREPGY